jgi:transcriptional regulator with PAS, ATPase and Fis domain
MIKPYPFPIPQQTQQESPPNEKQLRTMLEQEDWQEFMPVVQQFIDKFKLPYEIVIEDNKPHLRNILSRGQQKLQTFITVDPETKEMKLDALKMSTTPHEVLICGDSGTGKEIIAQAMIADRKGEIKAVNCAGFPETLIESELFGYVKGAFTGADTTRDGLMTAAAGGVMFLDEIGEMPMSVQAKLLRALQEKRIRRVGSNKTEEINCKFVFATNQDLNKMVKEGTFRKDLYARISTLELFINPLSKRKCDINPITESLQNGKAFLEKYGDDLHSGALDLSLNVRSLQQHVIRFNVLGKVLYNK